MVIVSINAMLVESLPKEINSIIVKNIPLSPCFKTVEEVNDVMVSLACLNKSWNLYINDSENTLSLIKKLSKRFDISDIEVAEKLSIKEAQSRYAIQTSALVVLKEYNAKMIHRHLDNIASQLDLNFTYSPDFLSEPTLLMGVSDLSSYYSGRTFVAEWLIKKSADINVLNKHKQNALMTTIWRFNFELIDMLLQHPLFDVKHVDCNGDTLLHYCIKCPHASSQNGMEKYEKMCRVITTLLEKGIDRNAVNKYGKTALDIAKCYTFKYEPFFKILDPDYNFQKGK
jgi:hypothetical protein